MAESDCGVACHRKINRVGRNTLGCFTASHNCVTLFFELSKTLVLFNRIFCPLAKLGVGCSFTRTETADVIKGSKAVNPKTNLHIKIHN